VVNVAVAVFQWRVLLSQQDDIHQQIELAKVQMELAERPWLSATAEIASAFHGSVSNGGTIQIAVKLKNLGNSPALQVRLEGGSMVLPTRYFSPSSDERDARRQLKDVCERGAQTVRALSYRDNYVSGLSVFPGEEARSEAMIAFLQADIERAAHENESGGLSPMVLLCITYKFPFGSELHHTGLVYELRGIRDLKIGKEIFVRDEDVDLRAREISTQNLKLMPWFLGSGYAN
jgi:hypothetical protein